MVFLRRHLTYANVAATLALFLALGGAAYAATRLPKNSVGTNQLKKGAVTTSKIAKKTRGQLKGDRGATGPQGPQGKIGKTGQTGARGLPGPQGVQGPDGTGPALEVFTSGKAVAAGGSTVVAGTLTGGSYVVSANVALESTGTLTSVTCSLNVSGVVAEAVGTVGVTGEPTTLPLSLTRTLPGAGSATVTCAAPKGATVIYANLISTQVKSQTRVAG